MKVLDSLKIFLLALLLSFTFTAVLVFSFPRLVSDEQVQLTVVRDLGPHSRERTLVVTELSPYHSWQFNLFLYDSWEALQQVVPDSQCSRPKPGHDVRIAAPVVDLFVACEPGVCGTLPQDCISWTYMDKLEDEAARCFFAEVATKPDEKYRFAHSLNFILIEPMTTILNMTRYSYFLRTDADAMLFPGILHYVPKGSTLFGHGFSGTEFTFAMIQQFAKERMGITDLKWKIDTMQSTYMIRREDFFHFTKTLVNNTKFIFDHAFEEDMCEKLPQSPLAQKFLPNKSTICKWPYWYQGVSSLYGTMLTANQIFESPTKTKKLDFLAAATGSISKSLTALDIIQGHLLIQKIFVHTALMSQSDICKEEVKSIDEVEQSDSFMKELGKASKIADLSPLKCTSHPSKYAAKIVIRSLRRACQTLVRAPQPDL